MKTTMACRLFFLLFVFSAVPVSHAAEFADYQASAQALSNMLQRFEKLAAPSSEFDVLMQRDPMRSLVDGNGGIISRAGFNDGLVLEGIIWSDEMKSVLVDDHFYKEGDTLGSYKILRIERNGFWAEIEDGSEKFIPLYPDSSTP